jgi:hypothetical protein
MLFSPLQVPGSGFLSVFNHCLSLEDYRAPQEREGAISSVHHFTGLCDLNHSTLTVPVKVSSPREDQERVSIVNAIEKLAVAGERAGFTIEQMVEL